MSILGSASERYLHDEFGNHVGAPWGATDERRINHNRHLAEHETLHRMLEPKYQETLLWQEQQRAPASNLRLAEQPTTSEHDTGGTD